MNKRKLQPPFFVVNPKAYLYGVQAETFAKICDELSEKYQIDVLFTCQHADLFRIKQATKHLIVTAQHMDGITSGRGMGHILPEGIVEAGAEAVFLNHAEHQMTVENLTKAIQRAEELGILTIVCANSILEAQTIATLHPDIMVCEPTELIGTGQSSDVSYMKETNAAVRAVDANIYLLQAAGISTTEDVRKALDSGADATGGTSGIVAAKDPAQTVENMLKEIVSWKEEQQ